jgi:hypothetical protein
MSVATKPAKLNPHLMGRPNLTPPGDLSAITIARRDPSLSLPPAGALSAEEQKARAVTASTEDLFYKKGAANAAAFRPLNWTYDSFEEDYAPLPNDDGGDGLPPGKRVRWITSFDGRHEIIEDIPPEPAPEAQQAEAPILAEPEPPAPEPLMALVDIAAAENETDEGGEEELEPDLTDDADAGPGGIAPVATLLAFGFSNPRMMEEAEDDPAPDAPPVPESAPLPAEDSVAAEAEAPALPTEPESEVAAEPEAAPAPVEEPDVAADTVAQIEPVPEEAASEPAAVALEPIEVAPQLIEDTAEPIAVAPQPVEVAQEFVAVALEPVEVAPEAVASEPVEVAPETVEVAAVPVALSAFDGIASVQAEAEDVERAAEPTPDKPVEAAADETPLFASVALAPMAIEEPAETSESAAPVAALGPEAPLTVEATVLDAAFPPEPADEQPPPPPAEYFYEPVAEGAVIESGEPEASLADDGALPPAFAEPAFEPGAETIAEEILAVPALDFRPAAEFAVAAEDVAPIESAASPVERELPVTAAEPEFAEVPLVLATPQSSVDPVFDAPLTATVENEIEAPAIAAEIVESDALVEPEPFVDASDDVEVPPLVIAEELSSSEEEAAAAPGVWATEPLPETDPAVEPAAADAPAWPAILEDARLAALRFEQAHVGDPAPATPPELPAYEDIIEAPALSLRDAALDAARDDTGATVEAALEPPPLAEVAPAVPPPVETIIEPPPVEFTAAPPAAEIAPPSAPPPEVTVAPPPLPVHVEAVVVVAPDPPSAAPPAVAAPSAVVATPSPAALAAERRAAAARAAQAHAAELASVIEGVLLSKSYANYEPEEDELPRPPVRIAPMKRVAVPPPAKPAPIMPAAFERARSTVRDANRTLVVASLAIILLGSFLATSLWRDGARDAPPEFPMVAPLIPTASLTPAAAEHELRALDRSAEPSAQKTLRPRPTSAKRQPNL